MKTYCPVRPRSSSRSASTWSGVKTIQSTTASKECPARPARAEAGSRMSPVRIFAPGGAGRTERPRLSR